MEILKKDITIDKKVGLEINQVLVEGDIIVPDTKPDINMVLEANGKAYINNKDIANERISFKGNLDINILFIAKGENKPIHSMNATYPINDFINMDNITNDMTVFTICNVTNLDYKLINDRKVSFRAILDVVTEVIGKDSFEIVENIDGLPSEQMKITKMNMNKIICSKFDKFNIKEEIELANGRPNISEILDISFNILNKDVRVLSDKITISGDMKASVLYKGEDDDSIITYFEQETHFNGSFGVENAEENMIGDVYLDIQEKNIKILENDDGEDRIISIDACVGCNIKVSYDEEIGVLEDAYALDSDIELEKNNQLYPVLVCKNKNQTSLKDIIKLDENCPPILQILKITGKPILDNVQSLDDKVVAEGIVECKILYITNDDEYPLYCFNAVMPYQQTIDAKGSTAHTNTNVNVILENININMVSDKDVEIRCSINFDTCITKQNDIAFITNVIFNEQNREKLEQIASITMYIVQDGDTLWNLSKKFNTTIGDIVSLNEIDSQNEVNIGQKLIILKKIR